MTVTEPVMIEDANIGFRNFSGEERQFNDEGDRNFVLFLNHDMAKSMEKDGWNIRWNEPRDPDEDPRGMLNVSVKFGKFPPKIVMITSEGQTQLNEDTVDILDSVEIEKVDLIIRPYNWEYKNRKGVKAYLKTLYVTIVEDDLDKKYSSRYEPSIDTDGDDLCPPF